MTNIPQPGTTLGGKYLVDQVLGVGGMGVVVAATHLQLDQKVAIKFLLPEALQSPEVVARFAREARAAAKIRGEHVARVIDVGSFDDGSPYMVLEYLDGHDLAKELEVHGPLSVEDAARYVLETCEALAEAHAARIVHRDLKPSNLFLAQQPDKRAIVKVLDFGISKVEEPKAAGLTKTSALMGTAFYMSPEQLTTPKNIDARSDLWSLGVIMYELLSGRQPFEGESVPEIIGAILQNEPVPLSTHRPDLPGEVVAVVERCLRSKARDRFANVAELAAALAPFAPPDSRRSVDTIARVLGTDVASALAATLSSAVVRPPTGTLASSHAATAALPATLPSSTSSVGSVTTNGVSTPVPAPKKKTATAPLLVGGAAAVVVATLAVTLIMGARDPSPSPTTGLVAPAAPPPAAAPLLSAPASVAAPPADPLPVVDAPAAPASPLASIAPPAKATSRAVPKAPTPPPPAARSGAVATAVPTSAATTAAPPAATSKNPLQMGIK